MPSNLSNLTITKPFDQNQICYRTCMQRLWIMLLVIFPCQVMATSLDVNNVLVACAMRMQCIQFGKGLVVLADSPPRHVKLSSAATEPLKACSLPKSVSSLFVVKFVTRRSTIDRCEFHCAEFGTRWPWNAVQPCQLFFTLHLHASRFEQRCSEQ